MLNATTEAYHGKRDTWSVDHVVRGQKALSATHCLAKQHGAFHAITLAALRKPKADQGSLQLRELENATAILPRKGTLTSTSERDKCVQECRGVIYHLSALSVLDRDFFKP